MPQPKNCALINSMLQRCLVNSRVWSMLLSATLVWGASQAHAADGQHEPPISVREECSVCDQNPGVLHLYAKDKHTWEIRHSGAHARLEFSRVENSFNLQAQALEPNTPYVLIQYESSYARGTGYIVVRGVSGPGGDLHLEGQWQRWEGKFWLVPQAEVSGQPGDGELDRLQHWNPERYLFEGRVL